MCDTAEDMDEYIEYEFARDCIEIADENDEEQQQEGAKEVLLGNELLQHDPQSLLIQHSGPLADDGFIYDDDHYEIVEHLDDEDVDQVLLADPALDIKAEILDPSEQEEQRQFKEEFIVEDVEENHLLDENEEKTSNGYQQHEDYEEIEYEDVAVLDSEDTQTEPESLITDNKDLLASPRLERMEKEDKPAPEPCPENKGPKGAARKYMLFDELVATVVDYDDDGTPIVEFSISNTESDENLPVECGICPDVMSKSKISAHLKTHLVAGTTNRYQCIYCEETYKDSKYLAGHARRHMGIRPYVCEICKLYFSTKQDLRVHNQRRHQEKDHICEVCGKTFAQNTQLKRHREATHEKKRRFKCDTCPKSYYKNFSLQEHIRAVHMGKRRIIVCPFCGMQCRDAHKMARHRKQFHLNQTHFECHICNEEFTDINYFDAHKRSIQCRNNTKRKLEEEQQQEDLQELQQEVVQEQQPEEVQMFVAHNIKRKRPNSKRKLEEEQQQEEVFQQQLLQDETNQVFAELHHAETIEEDDMRTVQIIEDCDYKNLISSSPPTIHHSHADHTGQFLLSNDLLQHHKIEQIVVGDDVADDEELVYEITIDSNE